MRAFNFLFLFAWAPAFCFAQTVHIQKNEIVYKGTVKIENATKEEIYRRAKQAILDHVKDSTSSFYNEDADKQEIIATGKIKLRSTYSIIKTLHYTIRLQATDKGYKYHIDSVYTEDKERGGKLTTTSSEELFKGMDVSGYVAINTEKKLNEIDMDFQYLLDLIKNEIANNTVIAQHNN